MRCKFRTVLNRCSGKYQGFACIENQCSYYAQSRKCEHHDPTGDYCWKYGRFGCVGRESCGSLADYLDAVAAGADS